MTEANAKKYLASLETRDLLQESKEAFHICLALGDIEKATSYAQAYQDMWYIRFFDAVCSIDNRESSDFFEANKDIWCYVLTYEIRLYCSAILLQQDIISKYGLCERLGFLDKDSVRLFGEANRLGLKELDRNTLLKSLQQLRLSQTIAHLFTFVNLHANAHHIKELFSLPKLDQALYNRLRFNRAYLETIETFEKALDILESMKHCTFLFFDQRQEIKYQFACKFCDTHRAQTDALMNTIDHSKIFFWKSEESMKHSNAIAPMMYGYRAAIAVGERNIETLNRLIEEVRAEVSLDDYHHSDALCLIANQALKAYPEIAEYALSKVHIVTSSAIQLQIALGKEPSKEMIYDALRISVSTIEEEYPMLAEELMLIAQMTNQESVHSKIFHWSTIIQDPRERYEVLTLLRSKLEIGFNDIYKVAKNISPLQPFYCVSAYDFYLKKLCKILESTPSINEDYLNNTSILEPMRREESYEKMCQCMRNKKKLNMDISEFLPQCSSHDKQS